MPETLSPREVFRKLIEGIGAGRFTELADLYAEDAVVETVFEPVGPRRVEGGRRSGSGSPKSPPTHPWSSPRRTWSSGTPTTRR
ncbi:hypothetical protein Scinn_73640 [Streptomyces virginiae]|uniref:SnoaL-like domain-containing protein n=1 Tax=Streptomyces virginiae TaxID=1961 RepID=A0ABQ3NYR0_STRVG|nr:hypothetical protein Scinn_73640 [Streptomyces virginiae]